MITFGLYKPQSVAQVRSSSSSQTGSSNREPGPIARSDRDARDAARREGRESRRDGREREGRGDRDSRDRDREGRPPRSSQVSTEVLNERLYVGNLSYDATESDLFELFAGSGSVKNSEVVVNSRTQRSKGFAFVTMMTLDGAKKAVTDLNGKDFMGRPLIVGGAKPMPPREERGDRDRGERSDRDERSERSEPEERRPTDDEIEESRDKAEESESSSPQAVA
ncbi:hypothetical protein FEM03_09535 [Phragmitibacter flavus]|uniref:RRM domain-containing protein n=2 Tax=Phragmitibacter flavus TaxID=2576071 RepID=A0A5R8KHZ2_9BACT|nr:hypothetical protein FEM03_09535 [Phragmitibacter flavus]